MSSNGWSSFLLNAIQPTPPGIWMTNQRRPKRDDGLSFIANTKAAGVLGAQPKLRRQRQFQLYSADCMAQMRCRRIHMAGLMPFIFDAMEPSTRLFIVATLRQ
ncbi:hypothetical protein LJR220_004427 [Bradyrhizobium sp. LjRoot220]|uniref:hypothetical protein n=1 Tax=Bradyrhizobium sp. LjRoot220 TaxID=3342284 RepID=UPI003ECE59F8